MKLFILLFLITTLFVLQDIVLAGTTGKITGRVIDASNNEPLPGANVLIEGTSLGASTGPDGYFSIINIPPDNYNVVVRFVGYSIVKIEKVEVNSDKTTRLGDIKMSTENVSVGEVVVVAQKPPIEKDRTFSESSINSKTIESLPVTTLEEVIQLQPGVVNEGGELHFRGGRGREVSYMIDGIAVTNDFNQGGGNNVSIENSMVQEVEVISGTFNAEYGSAQSGVVNIVTKGPAKTFSGSVSAYSGAWTSNKTDVFLGINKFNPAAEKDIQFSLSGPILTDKLGFFTSGRYNSSSSYLMYQKMFNTLDGWKIAAYQQWYQEHNPEQASESQAIYIPDSLRTGDMSTGPLHTSNSFSFNAKLDFNPVNSIRIGYQVFGSYSQSSDGDASRRYQPDDLPTNINTSQQHFLTFRDAPTDNFFYSISLSFQRDHWDSYYRKDNKVSQYPGDPGIQPITTSADGFSLGTTGGFYTGSDSKNYRNQYLATGNFNWQIDRNNFIKAGFEFKQHEINTYSWGYIETNQWETKMWPSKDLIDPQKLSFDQYWDKVVDYWKNWEQTYDTTMYRKYTSDEYTLWRDYTIRPMQAAAYIQDKLELGEIIINGGLRLDVFNPNEKYPVNDRIESYLLGSEQNLRKASVKYQLSPRLGISFPISANGAFHAAYGHFFQMPSFEYMYNEPLYALTPLQLNGKLLGNTNLDPEKTVSYEIGLQQSITSELGIDVTAYYKDFRNLLGIEQVTTVDAIGYQKFINRDYGYSKGITIGLKEGGSGFITGAINYTLSFSNGSSSDPKALELIQSASQIGGKPVQFVNRQVLPLDWDQRNTLNIIVNFNQPEDWNISLLGSIDSGTPYSPTFVDKYTVPVREYKNTGLKPTEWNVSLKAKKYFTIGKLKYAVFLKIDNLFDQLNQTSVYSTSGTADYNARLPQEQALEVSRLAQEGIFNLHQIDVNPEWYSSPRKIQLGMELSF